MIICYAFQYTCRVVAIHTHEVSAGDIETVRLAVGISKLLRQAPDFTLAIGDKHRGDIAGQYLDIIAAVAAEDSITRFKPLLFDGKTLAV